MKDRTTAAYLAAVVLTSFAFFMLTAAPGIGTEDSAELAGGARFLTMVHAPGYPLYLVLGRLATALSDEPGRGLVLLSVAAGIAAASLFFLALRRDHGAPSAAFAAVSLIFCQGFWEAATRIEVYAISLLLLTALLFILDELGRAPADARMKNLFGFVLGLTFAHHMGVLILLPVFAAYLLLVNPRVRPREWLAPALFALPGIALYLLLVVLSSREGTPIIDWPPITTLSRLRYVMSGAHFKELLFSVPRDEAITNIILLPLKLLSWFPLLGLIMSAIGLVVRARENPKSLVLFGGLFAVTTVHASNYKVLDPEIFMLPAILPVAWLSASGFEWISARAKFTERAGGALIAAYVVIAFGGRLAAGGMMTESMNSLSADVSRAVLDSHASDTEPALIWADWRYYPSLKFFMALEGRGGSVVLELDSTAKTPGSRYFHDRTFAMSPSFELGESYALKMEKMQWRVLEPNTLARFIDRSARLDSTRLLARFGGLDIVTATIPAAARTGEIIEAEVCFMRNELPAADTVLGELVLMFEGRPRISTPFAPWMWHLMPPEMETGVVYRETVQTIIPSTHGENARNSSFGFALRFESSDSYAWKELGPITVER